MKEDEEEEKKGGEASNVDDVWKRESGNGNRFVPTSE